jgi:phosphoglycolate phosphatase
VNPFTDTCRAIVFDMDGTLLDTLADIADSVNAVLRRRGFPEHDYAAYRQFVGEGVSELLRRALPPSVNGVEAVVGECSLAMRGEYSARCMDKTRAYPGVAGLLDALQTKRVPMSVLSNKPDDMIRLLLEKYFPSISFHAALGAGSSFPKKPDPAAALWISRSLNIPPECFIFLGDSKTDMETATAAGMYPAGALWGFRDAAELLGHGAKVLISRPEELVRYF